MSPSLALSQINKKMNLKKKSLLKRDAVELDSKEYIAIF